MRKLHIILALAFGPALIAACFAFLMPQGGSAYNTYVNEYRKWPWRAGFEPRQRGFAPPPSADRSALPLRCP